MPLYRYSNGLLVRNGGLAADSGCCCSAPCTCNTCEAHIYVNGVEVPFTPLTDFFGNPTCDPCRVAYFNEGAAIWASIPCAAAPPWATACEDVLGQGRTFGPCVGDDEFSPNRIYYCSTECSYRAAACYSCENDQPTVRIHYVAFYVVSYATCAGGSNAVTVLGRFWYRDYALPALPPCDGPAIPLEQVGEDVPLDKGCFDNPDGSDEMCGCELTASILCIGPDFP